MTSARRVYREQFLSLLCTSSLNLRPEEGLNVHFIINRVIFVLIDRLNNVIEKHLWAAADDGDLPWLGVTGASPGMELNGDLKKSAV